MLLHHKRTVALLSTQLLRRIRVSLAFAQLSGISGFNHKALNLSSSDSNLEIEFIAKANKLGIIFVILTVSEFGSITHSERNPPNLSRASTKPDSRLLNNKINK